MHAKSLQLCPTLCNPIDCSLPGSSVHEIFQARILEWVTMPSSRGSSWHRDQSRVSYISCIGRQVLLLATPGKLNQSVEVVKSRFWWGYFQNHLYGHWQTLGPHWLLTGDVGSLSHDPCHRAPHNTAAVFLQRQPMGHEERKGKWQLPFLCNLILKVISHHLCHILLFSNESLGPAHTQVIKRESWFIRGKPKGCLPHLCIKWKWYSLPFKMVDYKSTT